MSFVGHAHVHDEFSPLDGTGSRNQLTREAVKKGQTHLGCTNHGRLGSILDHVHACRNPEAHDDPDEPGKKRSKDETLIPWLGIEAFWRPNRFMDLGKNGHNWAQHLCFHAGSLNGWRALMRLSSKSWVRRENGGGFFGKPCFDWAMLEEDHEDILVSTACLASPLSQLIIDGSEEDAKGWCLDMIDIVGDKNFFIEIMPHDLDMQRQVNIGKINIANDLGVPYFVTGDVHMPYQCWKTTQSVVRMASYGTNFSEQEKKKDRGEDVYTEEIDTLYLSSEAELMKMFADYHPHIPRDAIKEGLSNTEVFASRFKPYVIGRTTKLPKVTKSPKQAMQIIQDWCNEGMDRIGKSDDAEYEARLQYEFDVLKDKGVFDYFVMVGDMVRWAKSDEPLPGDHRKKRPIRVGLGRGSAAGCLISYLIGITAIDPIAWGLLFERFLNPDRVGLPDIDLDFETDNNVMNVEIEDGTHEWLDGRAMVKEYLKRKYGRDHVADIIAYQTFAPRAVIQSVGSVYEIPFEEVKKVTDSIGDTERDLVKIAQDNEVVSNFRDSHKEAWIHIMRLEDQILRDSRHAGGVVITDKPTNYYVPTQLGADEKSTVTAWADRAEFPIVSDYGLVKMDVLGITSLTKQELAVQHIRNFYETDFEPNDLPVLHNPYDTQQKVIDAFVRGQTLGVFQFGGRGITQLLRHIRPTNAIDIAVANALYRPGPIKIAFEYGDRKSGKIPESEWYWHESLEPILKETLGLIAFQEQVMSMTKMLGNFTGGEADSMRKAISKLYRLPGDKAREFMEQWRQKWVDGCVKNGLSEEVAIHIWEKILEFAGYGFNKSHSASYALQAYQDMHIKIHWPLAFYASLLTIEKKPKKADQIQFLKGVMREARIFDVDIQRPDVNLSERGWSIDPNGKLRYGLTSVAGMGGANVGTVIAHRPYKSFRHYIKKIPSTIGINVTLSLVKSGAFDSIADRSVLLSSTRAYSEKIERLTIEMDCGCKKSRTVKLTDKMLEQIKEEFEVKSNATKDLMEMAIEITLDEVNHPPVTARGVQNPSCKKHPGATVAKWEKLPAIIPIAAWMKDHPNEKLPLHEPPSHRSIIDMETEVLNIPLSLAQLITKYAPFIEERIFTEEEFDALPAKPKKSREKHGAYCSCKDCKAAQVVVGGEIISKKVITTKRGEKMAFVDVAFGVNQWNLTFFPGSYTKHAKLLERPTAFLFRGHKGDRGEVLVWDMRDVVDVADAEGWKPPIDEGAEIINMGGGIQGLVLKKQADNRKRLKIRSKAA